MGLCVFPFSRVVYPMSHIDDNNASVLSKWRFVEDVGYYNIMFKHRRRRRVESIITRNDNNNINTTMSITRKCLEHL